MSDNAARAETWLRKTFGAQRNYRDEVASLTALLAETHSAGWEASTKARAELIKTLTRWEGELNQRAMAHREAESRVRELEAEVGRYKAHHDAMCSGYEDCTAALSGSPAATKEPRHSPHCASLVSTGAWRPSTGGPCDCSAGPPASEAE